MEQASVVIVNWNAGPALRACLGALLATEGGDPPQVTLVDNASTDGSQMALASAYPALETIQNARNVGFARAANQGLRAAPGEFVVLLNPDVILLPSAVPRLIHFMTTHPDAGIAGPRLLDPDGTVQGSARRDPSAWTGLFGRSAPLTRLFPHNPVSQRELPALSVEGEVPIRVDWVSGACLVVRRTAWEQVGLLDERFFLFWEDADWCLRFREAGLGVYYVPAACGTHLVGVSRAGRRLGSVWDFHVSAYRYYRKHRLPSAVHPLTIVVGGGLLVSLALRSIQALMRPGRGVFPRPALRR
jgi:N-acetylglucosaminyl-diphospho-decaprenol L-rhamnosyltransferase